MGNSVIETMRVSPAASVIISMSLILFLGFLTTRITKRLRLPNVTAYILTGVLMGPWCLNVIPVSFVRGSGFLPDIALSFIAFSTGEYFKLETLRKNGAKVLVITALEALLTTALVFFLMYRVLHLSLAFSVVLGALSAATAPASTMMTIRQTRARGDFVDTLLQVVALDDVVGLLAYSAAVSIAELSIGAAGAGAVGAAGTAGAGAAAVSGSAAFFSPAGLLLPVASNLGVLLLGGAFGLLLHLMLSRKHSTDNRLIVAIALLFGFCGVCTWLDISPLLGCMMMGAVYANLNADDNLFKQMNYFSPPILLMFFVRSGLSFDLGALLNPSGVIGTVPLLVIGVLYFLTRIAGKYSGAWIGCFLTGKDRKVRNWLGLALFPQAGVAIGLAALGARILKGEAGNALNTVILSSSVLYELIGPGCAKLALYMSGSYSERLEEIVEVPELDENGRQKSSLDLLIERIRRIQEEIPEHYVPEEEQAFSEAAEEQYRIYGSYLKNRFGRGRR